MVNVVCSLIRCHLDNRSFPLLAYRWGIARIASKYMATKCYKPPRWTVSIIDLFLCRLDGAWKLHPRVTATVRLLETRNKQRKSSWLISTVAHRKYRYIYIAQLIHKSSKKKRGRTDTKSFSMHAFRRPILPTASGAAAWFIIRKHLRGYDFLYQSLIFIIRSGESIRTTPVRIGHL